MNLKVSSLNARYGTSHVLHDVSLEVNEGESVALIGRNGAGKSSTLHSIIGILRTTTGSVTIDGEEVLGLQPHQIVRRGLGFVPETRRIFANLTVYENLQVGARSSRSESGRTLDAVMEAFPLLRKLSRSLGGSLSGGEQQVLTIARTLMGNPKLLMLDEPTEGLAPTILEALEDQLLQLRDSGVPMVLSEQHLPFALALSQRVYVIDRGSIKFHGTTEELASNDEVRNRYLAV